jgi:hypothetical protein
MANCTMIAPRERSGGGALHLTMQEAVAETRRLEKELLVWHRL